MDARRLPAAPGEELDRGRLIGFSFDGRRRQGFAGDTIGSALAAAGVGVISRSFKYHRPRGLLCAAGRCPNCLVNVDGTPNVRACTTPITAGMRVRSQNAWPSLRWDLLALTDRFDRFLPVGFYYKTFIRPRRLWPLYERVLRHVAGIGRVDGRTQRREHPAKRHLHCAVAVIGGGPAGCLAALDAAAEGSRVVLVDDQHGLGGHLRFQSRPVVGDPRLAGESGVAAAARLAQLVSAESRIEHLADATAIGVYEGGLIGVTQGQRFLRIRARHIIVATGVAERPSLFEGNDRPGVMLASALLRLRHLHGVALGGRAVVVTDDDHGWNAAVELLEAGITVVALVDRRAAEGLPSIAARLSAAGVELLVASTPLATMGRDAVRGLRIATAAGERRLTCDIVAMAGRQEPVIALLAQAGARVRFDERLGEFTADEVPAGVQAAGEVLGLGESEASRSGPAPGGRAGIEDAAEIGMASGGKQFVCLCEDVTVKELRQGIVEGFTDLETLKRYSTVTMGPCQGKMCHVNAARVHQRITGASAAHTGFTTARPPFQPVMLAALAGPHLAPVRRTALHARHAELNARWTDMGDWKRPLSYESVEAEVQAVREAAGIIDVSTLGKLDVQGTDAGAFLDWLHPNRFSDLPVGRVRYRAMLDDAGILIDDGTVARLGEQRFFLSTTTTSLDAVDQWLRWWLAGSTRDVSVTNVTSHLAAVNLAGPRSREVLARVTELDVSREAMPYLAAIEGPVAGIPAIILRIGFVGELGFEIHVPADYATHLWDELSAAGRDLGLRPFGVEAQRVLRLEKQHAIVGQDTDALSNPIDAGMGWLIKSDKPDFIGRDALLGPRQHDGRQVLTGFEIVGARLPAEGAAIVRDGQAIGRVTSAKWSPTLGHPIGLAWIAQEAAVDGAALTIRMGIGRDGETVEGRVRARPFYDPGGERLRT